MLNIFNKIKKEKKTRLPKSVFPFFSSQEKNITAISIDENWIKIVHARGKPRKRKVCFLWDESLEGLDEEQIISQVKALLLKNGITSSHFLISHPSHLTRARALRLPSSNLEELKTMVDLQVEKYTPDAKEETLTYFRVMDSDGQGYSNVLLVMAHQDSIARSTRIVQKLGGKVTAIGSDIEGLINWYKQNKPPGNQQLSEGGTLLIDMDREHASLLIFYGTEAYYHRTIPLKMEALLQDESGDVFSQFSAEVHRSLMAYDEEGFKAPCLRVILTGEAVKLSGMMEKIQKNFGLPTVFVPTVTGVLLNESSAQYFSERSQVSFASLFGFLAGNVSGDLTPSAMRVRQTFQKKVKAASLLGAQVLFGLLLVSGFLLYQINQDMAYESLLRQKTKQMEKPAGEIETALEHLKIVKNTLEKRGVLLDALVTIKEVTPPEVQWDEATYVQGESLVIKGVSRQIAKVFEMITALEKSPIFIKPEAKKVTKRKVDDKDVTDFELVLPLAGTE